MWVAWVAQSVKHLTSAQVMISRFVSSSPAWGSLLLTQTRFRASLPSPPCHSPNSRAHTLSLSKINKHFFKN